MGETAERRIGETYRDRLRQAEPARTGGDWVGGAYGCPGEYFRGAPVFAENKCRPLRAARCGVCWSRPWRGETGEGEVGTLPAGGLG